MDLAIEALPVAINRNNCNYQVLYFNYFTNPTFLVETFLVSKNGLFFIYCQFTLSISSYSLLNIQTRAGFMGKQTE